jgi:hydrogenase maturation protein HypF
MAIVRKRLLVTGTVQGVGFRPFVWRLARRYGLSGFVANGPQGVVIELQGRQASIDDLIGRLRTEAPPLAEITGLDAATMPVDPAQPATFLIQASDERHGTRMDRTAAPADVATCAACLTDVLDPANRRFGYPFTTCSDCGPRFTIIQSLPYDRPRTTMAAFSLCPTCAGEYADPEDRRFHAQPIACPACGPTVWFTTAGDPGGVAVSRPDAGCVGSDAIARARSRLRAGDVLAIKGLGGFHLACDATHDAAVERLRARKRRKVKPLAVMVVDVAMAREYGYVDEQERLLLESRARPIVLVRKRPDGGGLAAGIGPGNDFVGLMLPHSPLQHLLGEGLPPLVMTSGNVSEEPIAHDNLHACARLAPLVDGFVMHDRAIVTPCDDSVVRCVAGAPVPIRRSRGYAPLSIRLNRGGPATLAVGGELKNAVCLVRGDLAIMSQHIGDVGNLETLDALGRAAEHLQHLCDVRPTLIACDMHPGSLSTAWARRVAADRGIPLVAVQHHEAHVASLLADHAAIDMPIIGVCFDGTGYGRDGTIQGGEVFVAARGAAAAMRRAACLVPFPLPGGDAAIRHPWRVALATLHAAGLAADPRLPPLVAHAPEAVRVVRRQLEVGINCVATTSMGRLFDAVAALAGVTQSIGYEAEAAMHLEALAAGAGPARDARAAYPLPVIAGEPLRIDWRPAVAGVVADVLAGVGVAVIASRFHTGVAGAVVDVCDRLRCATGITAVGLTGGVFQNALLVRLAADGLRDAGFDVLLHERVPPNDGGLALGQAVLGRTGL